ncbi:MAG: YbcC family protein [Rhodanobacter sp.]
MSVSEAMTDFAGTGTGVDAGAVREACAQAVHSIAPSWPLDGAVAINPHWYRIHMPVREVAARLVLLGGINVLPQQGYLRECWSQGRITSADLEAARAQSTIADLPDAQALVAALYEPPVTAMPLIVDELDDSAGGTRHLPWRGEIMFQLSQVCAAYFDKDQSHWLPRAPQGLYRFWTDTLRHEKGLGMVMGLPGLRDTLRGLPDTAEVAMHWALARLQLPETALEPYFESLLLSINGWASWCAWLKYQADGRGLADRHLEELLAMRLVWEALLLECHPHRADMAAARLRMAWAVFPQRLAAVTHRARIDEVWQMALEQRFQRELADKLQAAVGLGHGAAPADAQMVFCIDIRSEPMRRALEALDDRIQTRAFAGFFGLPMSYRPLGAPTSRPQLPGLAFPEVEVEDQILAPADSSPDDAPARRQRMRRLAAHGQWQNTTRWPNTTFSYVEAVGFGYLRRLWQWLRPPATPRHNDDHHGLPHACRTLARPRLMGVPLERQVALAAGALRVMGIDRELAPLVVLTGHASQSCNNAHASTLDCGACGGQSGEANVRALAALLNEPEVRAALARDEGIEIPQATWFMAALHNTTTDEIQGFDLDLLPAPKHPRWQQLQQTLERAGDRVRRERAPSLWMSATGSPDEVLTRFRRRANDGSETRPEWGLTTNAGFIIGPRELTRHASFTRCYLHDYDAQADTDFSVLEKLMLGPLVVTHWLGWQYHASTTDPLHYGAGNKVLHNVIGGRIGVFEGNGGDLRIGIPRQSLSDGRTWRHEPLRQTTVIAAPRDAIDDILARHEVLQRIIGNGWMILWQYEGGRLMRWTDGRWLPLKQDVSGVE